MLIKIKFMNKRQFLKTGIIGSIISVFAPKLLAAKAQNKLPNKVFNTNMTLTTSMIVTKESGYILKAINNGNLKNCFYEIEGNLEGILIKQHFQTLAIMAKGIIESDENKHLKLDLNETMDILKEKYKINLN